MTYKLGMGLQFLTTQGNMHIILRKNLFERNLPLSNFNGQCTGNKILRSLEAEFEKGQNCKVLGNEKF